MSLTWGDLADSGLTWGDLVKAGISWGDLEKLTAEDLQGFVGRARPVLDLLTPRELREFADGVRDGTLPPGLVADGGSQYSRIQEVALSIWTTVLPHDRGEVLTYIALLLALVGAIEGAQSDDAPSTIVHVEVTTPRDPAAPTEPSTGRDLQVRPIPLAPPASDEDEGPRGI